MQRDTVLRGQGGVCERRRGPPLLALTFRSQGAPYSATASIVLSFCSRA